MQRIRTSKLGGRGCHAQALGILASLGIVMLVGAPLGYAADVECGDNPSTNSTLGGDTYCCDDIACDGNGAIDLGSGADLDMKGFDIICLCGETFCSIDHETGCTQNSDCSGGGSQVCVDPTCTACTYAAVKSSANGSVIKNTGAGDSTIFGNFKSGVDCQSKSASKVEGITVKIGGQSVVNGIANCAQVKENVVFFDEDAAAPLFSTGISNAGLISNTDFIRDNYIKGWGAGVGVAGTKNITVDHNFIYMSSGVASNGVHGDLSTASGLAVDDNVIMGVGASTNAIISSSTPGTASGNICDPENTDACDDCVNNGDCLASAPFTLP